MMHNLISYYGFSRMPFGRDLAPGMLHRHSAHNEAVARIDWCIAERRIGVITGEVLGPRPERLREAKEAAAAFDATGVPVNYRSPPPVPTRPSVAVLRAAR
jgi:type II secretory pathway predicted ATPase ExeA